MKALASLMAGVAAAFPEKELLYNNARLVKILGGANVVYDFAFAPGYANIFHNTHGLIRIMIDNKNGSGDIQITEDCPVQVDAIIYDYRFTNAKIKFRKFSAKNIDEAQKKLVKWFVANAQAMQAVQFN